MSAAEWTLWITSTVFQGVLAWSVIWENRKAIKIREKQIALVEAHGKSWSKQEKALSNG